MPTPELSDHPDASDLAQREHEVLTDLTATIARLLADPRDIAAVLTAHAQNDS